MSKYKSRFCPSPTGFLHLGNLRTALLNVLLALQSKGTFLLRIEDTDLVRSEKRYAEAVCDDLEWMELNWQEGPRVGGSQVPYFQSERNNIYESFYEKLLTEDLIYPCFMSEEELKVIRRNQMAAGQPPRYNGAWANASKEEVDKEIAKGSKPVYRFRIPKDKVINFTDLVKGEQRFLGSDLDDFIVKKQDSSPTFMFANAIDDSLMGINVVLRGDDHLSNTPRQIALLQALDLTIPEFIHVALFTGDDGSPLSKRNGSLSVQELREAGYFPKAVANYLSRVGHTIGDNELRSLEELSAVFNIDNISNSPSKFDIDQLGFWQKKVVESESTSNLLDWLKPYLENDMPEDVDLGQFVELIRENILFPKDAIEFLDSLFIHPLASSEKVSFIIKETGSDFFNIAKILVKENWGDWPQTMKEIGSKSGNKGKELFMPIRAAITGHLSGPELDQVTELLGLERVVNRLEEASKI
ncbi:MAG TPA: glutamate--tRNA ligase [Gammaproteobacteria bacterium]|jgi:glutamyl-tRNA synthetase|nr:glutamate--tRNA ligase [Gammaproteobacteria bacterium]HIK72793.1 glutamate--tRNA ligase [Gammaproteobacteria bacterium]